MTVRTATTSALAGLLLLTACGSTELSADEPPGRTPSAESSPLPPTFEACGREPAPPGTTNLRPFELAGVARAAVRAWGGSAIDGRVVLEHATDLTLPIGMLGLGNGYEAAVGGLAELRKVAPPGTTAPVTLAVVDSPTGGRSVAFVEVRVGAGVPVRWEEDPGLGFVTDGGDGGVWVPARRDEGAADDAAAFDSIDAMFPGGDSGSGNVCVVRSTSAGVDGVEFLAGYGDGGYPTFVGYDDADEVVSVVSHGLIVPWALSGLPGEPPTGTDI